MTADEYKAKFAEPSTVLGGTQHGVEAVGCIRGDTDKSIKVADTRAGRALTHALDIRKFEIELYWKRATYYWAFIAAAFAGYALTYKTAADREPWLSLLFTSLGLIFSVAWFLVNRGSKFWQNNWERHVDLLEGITMGPLHKIIATNEESNKLTAAGQFSVTKINQLLSVFVSFVWFVLLAKSVGPVALDREFDVAKTVVVVLTSVGVLTLFKFGRSDQGHTKTVLRERTFEIGR